MTEKAQGKNEEIDLFHFLKPVVELSKRIWRTFSIHFRMLYMFRIAALLIFLSIAAIGFSTRYWLPKAYKTEGLFVSQVLPGSYCSMMIAQLNDVVSSGANNAIVAEQLGVNEAVVGDLKSMHVIAIDDTLFAKQADTTFSPFRIELVLWNMQHLEDIQKGILNYLETSEYAEKRLSARKKSLIALKQEYKSRRSSLDTLKRIVNNSVTPRSEGRGIIFGEPLNPVLVYDAEKNYYDTELKVTEDLAVLRNIDVIQSFLKRNDYNYPDFSFIFLNFVIAGFIVSIIATPFLFSKKWK